MDNEINIVGLIESEFQIVQIKNSRTHYYFKLRTERKGIQKINERDFDIFNCLVSDHVEINPTIDLQKGSLIRIHGSIQTNRINKDGVVFEAVYIVVSKLTLEKSASVDIFKINTSIVTPIKQKGTYNKNQRYSSTKPYHDNFPREYDLRRTITCTCGREFKEDLDECPNCGKSVIEILREISNKN